MPSKGWPFTKPVGIITGLLQQAVNDQYRRLETKIVLSHQGHRFRFTLNQPVDVLVTVSSKGAQRHGWYRAGYLANVLTGTPIPDPIQAVERLYFGEQHLTAPYTGAAHYFEFWPHIWITDYTIEIWAKQQHQHIEVDPIIPGFDGGLLFFGVGSGLPVREFTFNGELHHLSMSSNEFSDNCPWLGLPYQADR